MKDSPLKSRQTVVENLISGGVCKKLQSYKHGHVSKDNMASSCLHLLGKIRIKLQRYIFYCLISNLLHA